MEDAEHDIERRNGTEINARSVRGPLLVAILIFGLVVLTDSYRVKTMHWSVFPPTVDGGYYKGIGFIAFDGKMQIALVRSFDPIARIRLMRTTRAELEFMKSRWPTMFEANFRFKHERDSLLLRTPIWLLIVLSAFSAHIYIKIYRASRAKVRR